MRLWTEVAIQDTVISIATTLEGVMCAILFIGEARPKTCRRADG